MINRMTPCCGVLLMLLSVPAAAQNLLTNPDFDTDLAGWTGSEVGSATWHGTDVDDAPDSGSARIVNDLADPQTEAVVMSQCIPIEPGEYQYGGHAFIPGGQAASGSVVMRVLGYSDTTNCTGGLFMVNGRLIDQTGDWSALAVDLSVSAGLLSGAAGSIEFELAIRKTEAGGELVAFADELFIALSPLIFSDRFESN